MNLRTLVLPAAATVLAAATAAAQSADSAVVTEAPYANSLAVQVNSSPTIGLWHRFSPRVEAGVEVTARRVTNRYSNEATEQKTRFTSVGVGPAIKVYTGAAGSLRPYMFGSAGVSFIDTRNEAPDGSGGTAVNKQKGHAVDGALALGLEWRPAERVSIGGHAGVLGSWAKGTVAFSPSVDADTHDSLIGTFNSGIRVQLYF